MNLVTDLQTALEGAGIESTVTYEPDDDYFPTVHLGGDWCVGVDGACLNVGIGPYGVNHPQDRNGKFILSQPLMTPADVLAYLRSHGAC